MDLEQLFTAYYVQYRGESEVPATTDPEFTIATRMFNEGINRWANYDGVYWKELFTTLQSAATGDKTITAGTITYAAPDDMREAGGFVEVKNAQGNVQKRYSIINPEEAQFRSDNGSYCYFTGNPSDGFTLNLNPSPDSSLNGMDIDYIYYKKPSELSVAADTTEMANPYFLVHHALANRFRVSRNFGSYQTAKRDAEELLKIMKIDNDSGTWANPWQAPDRSGAHFGDSIRSQWRF